MGLNAVELVFWMLGIRGHIPQCDYHPLSEASPSASIATRFTAILAACAAGLAVLASAVWLTVWLTITLL
jgi:hypothetical protein